MRRPLATLSNEQLCKVALFCVMELAVRMGACSDSGTSGEESSDDDGNPGPGQPVQLPESVIEDLLQRNQQRQADQMAGVGSEQRPNAEEEDQPREREPKRGRFD